MERKHRYFDYDFKREAVALSYLKNNNAKLERELNIPPGLIHKWRQEYEKFGAGSFNGKGRPKIMLEKTIIFEQNKTYTKSKCRFFNSDFKEKAVQISYQRSNISQLERELNITAGLLHEWRKTFEKFGTGCFCGKGNIKIDPEQQKINDLETNCFEAELHLQILKKSLPYLKKDFSAIFEFVKENERKYTIYKMCRVLKISESTYRLWKKQTLSDTKQRVVLLKQKITSVFLESSKRYGCVRIAKELTNSGTKISYSQVGFYMAQMGLRPKAKRKFKITTDSKHNFYTFPNLLNQQFKVDCAAKIWVSDITYIQTNKRFLYLTIIMDLYDRKIIGWSLSSTMTAERTSIAAWEMAVVNRNVAEGLLFHSDRGVQYACRSFTKRLDSYNCIIRSMSRKENSLDNAPAESFFNTLKRELIYRSKFLSKKEMKVAIIDFIENWYNTKRIHSSLNYQTIEEFNRNK